MTEGIITIPIEAPTKPLATDTKKAATTYSEKRVQSTDASVSKQYQELLTELRTLQGSQTPDQISTGRPLEGAITVAAPPREQVEEYIHEHTGVSTPDGYLTIHGRPAAEATTATVPNPLEIQAPETEEVPSANAAEQAKPPVIEETPVTNDSQTDERQLEHTEEKKDPKKNEKMQKDDEDFLSSFADRLITFSEKAATKPIHRRTVVKGMAATGVAIGAQKLGVFDRLLGLISHATKEGPLKEKREIYRSLTKHGYELMKGLDAHNGLFYQFSSKDKYEYVYSLTTAL